VIYDYLISYTTKCTIIIKLRPLDSSSLRTLNHASLQSDSGDLTVASQLIIADRFTMVTITVPLQTVTTLAAEKAFLIAGYMFGPPISLLINNGP
jgi:hypothetical protein